MAELKEGHYYRFAPASTDIRANRIIVIHKIHSFTPNNVVCMDYQFFDDDEIRIGFYTDPKIWVEV